MTTACSCPPGLIGAFAADALMAEASLSPKPGLVTPFSTGAHTDMDFEMFVASAQALRPYFEACVAEGEAARIRGEQPEVLLDTVRHLGLMAEQEMYRATGGINTHKGAVFCLGLLSAAAGSVLAFPQRRTWDGLLGDAVCGHVAEVCEGMVERELAGSADRPPRTGGEMLYRMHGVRGARGHAEDGYPILKREVLPRLREGRHAFSLACQDALLASMAALEDTCLLARGGFVGLGLAQRGAAQALQAGGAGSPGGRHCIRVLDDRLCSQRLSPGGSADMLAAGLFLLQLEQWAARQDWDAQSRQHRVPSMH